MAQARWTNILRYAHCDPLDAGAPWDGVALLWYRDEAARLAHVADAAARATMRADEAEAFARPVREFSTLVEEVRVDGDGSGPIRHFVFLWRAPGIDRADFQARLLGMAPRRRDVLAPIAGFRGLSLDLARAEAGLEGFGLEDLGIATGRTLPVDEYLQTVYPNILACGDVAEATIERIGTLRNPVAGA